MISLRMRGYKWFLNIVGMFAIWFNANVLIMSLFCFSSFFMSLSPSSSSSSFSSFSYFLSSSELLLNVTLPNVSSTLGFSNNKRILVKYADICSFSIFKHSILTKSTCLRTEKHEIVFGPNKDMSSLQEQALESWEDVRKVIKIALVWEAASCN